MDKMDEILQRVTTLESMVRRSALITQGERLRRVEARLYRFFTFMNFDCGMRKPAWKDGVVTLHSTDTSVADMLEAVPEDWGSAPFAVEHFSKGKRTTILKLEKAYG